MYVDDVILMATITIMFKQNEFINLESLLNNRFLCVFW